MVDKVKVQFEIDAKQALLLLNKLDNKIDETSKKGKKGFDTLGSSFNVFIGSLAAQGTARAIDAVVQGLNDSFNAALEFESGLIEVAKTSNLTEKELAELTKGIDDLTTILPVSSKELLETAKVAGQLGVTGSKNILNFAETISKLGKVSNLEGEFAASTLARILNITREGTEDVETFASVIVALGNNFAATESEIATVTSEVARASAQFGFTSADAAALATTLRAVGVRAEEAGTTVSKSLLAIETAVKNGGAELKQLERITGQTGDELKKQFAEDAPAVFSSFVKGLNRLKGENAIIANELAAVGIEGIRVNKVLPTLASNYDELQRAIGIASFETKNASALNNEFNRALESSESQVQLLENAYDKLSRRIGENFTSALKKASPLLIDFISGLAETDAETFARQTNDAQKLSKELEILKNKIEAINADGKVSFFEADPVQLAQDITAIQAKLDQVNTAAAREQLEALQNELKVLQNQPEIPELTGIFPDEASLSAQEEAVKTKIENLKNFLAVQSGEINAQAKAAREADIKDSINDDQKKFDALNALKESRSEREAEEAEAEKLAKQAELDADFQQLEENLGRKEAANILFRSKELAEEGKQAKAKKVIADAVAKSEQANIKRRLQFEAQKNTALVSLAAASANSIAQIAGTSAKTQFLLSKAIGVAQVLINSNIAASLATATIPPPAGEAIAAQRLIAGKIQAATIGAAAVGEFATRFQSGGFVGNGPASGDQVGIRVNRNEAVLNTSQQREFLAIANGQRGGANSDVAGAINNLAAALAGRDMVVQLDGREIFRATQDQLDSGSEFKSFGAA